MRAAHSFEVALPPGYPVPYLRRALSRDIHSVTERFSGDAYTAGVILDSGGAPHPSPLPIGWGEGEPALLRLRLSNESVQAEVSGKQIRDEVPTGRDSIPLVPTGVQAHRWVVGLTGLDQDTAGFGRLVRRQGLGRLIAGRPELRISQIGNLFDALLWSVIGQQIHFQFACLLRRRLTERAGTQPSPRRICSSCSFPVKRPITR